jgi:hypothetical protein
MDGVGYAGADGRGFRGLMAARPHDRAECEEHFDPLGGRNDSKGLSVRSLAAEPKTRQF